MINRGLENFETAFALLLEYLSDVEALARNVVVCQDCFAQLSSFLLKIRTILLEIQEASKTSLSTIYVTVQHIEADLKNAKELINICTIKSKFYLLLNSQAYATSLQAILRSIASRMLQLTSETVDVTIKLKNKIRYLCRDIELTDVKVSPDVEDMLNDVEICTRDRYMGERKSSDILHKMATLAAVSLDPPSLRREYDQLKNEKERISANKHEVEVHRLEQVINILGSADALSSANERDRQYKEHRRSMDNDMIPPLQTFYCPITQEVMENPVEIESGHTFEMSAIQKWFADGHCVCPVSKIELRSLALRPNRLLQQSIEEWKDINTRKKISIMEPKLRSDNEEVIINALIQIQEICEEKFVHKYWVSAEGLLPVLVDFLTSNKRELRKQALATLVSVVGDNSENKIKLCDAGAVEYTVRSLARDPNESKQAVHLLLELAKVEDLRDRISRVQGCILLLVTMANSEKTIAANYAKELLKIMSATDENVIQMAKVNYFKPLVDRLDSGLETTQILMANTISQIELTDQNKTFMVQSGVLVPLVKMISKGNSDSKAAALGALRNLSDLPENRSPIIDAGVMNPLLDLLFTVKTVSATIRERAAATFANLAMSCQSSSMCDLWGDRKDTDESILQLVSLLNLTGPNIQSHVLRALDHICSRSNSMAYGNILREGGIIQLLVKLIDAKQNEVRLQGLKLLFTLTKDGGADNMATSMVPDSYKVLVELFTAESLEEEKATAMGILGNLPLHNRLVTDRMLSAGVLFSIKAILEKCGSRSMARRNTSLVENALWTLVRFTLPTDISIQQYTASLDFIPLLVNLLSSGTPLAKTRATMSLEQFAQNTMKLSTPIKRSGSWFCLAPPPQTGCIVHKGICSVNGTFCLLEADAIVPLIQVLEERDEDLDNSALAALVTLVSDDCWEKGTDVIADSDGVRPVIRKLTSDSTAVQEKALLILEKVFRKEKYKEAFGSMAQMSLVSLTQDGTNLTRPLAAKILAHLNILHQQSTYF